MHGRTLGVKGGWIEVAGGVPSSNSAWSGRIEASSIDPAWSRWIEAASILSSLDPADPTAETDDALGSRAEVIGLISAARPIGFSVSSSSMAGWGSSSMLSASPQPTGSTSLASSVGQGGVGMGREAAANSVGVWAASWVGVDDGRETTAEGDVADGDRAATAGVWGGGSLSFKSIFFFPEIFDATTIYMESGTTPLREKTTCQHVENLL